MQNYEPPNTRSCTAESGGTATDRGRNVRQKVEKLEAKVEEQGSWLSLLREEACKDMDTMRKLTLERDAARKQLGASREIIATVTLQVNTENPTLHAAPFFFFFERSLLS